MGLAGTKKGPNDSRITFTLDGIDNGEVTLIVLVDGKEALHKTIMVGNGIIPTQPPVANFSGTPLSGTAPLIVKFTDTSTHFPTSRKWSFGDGSRVNSSKQNPIHTYTKAGTYRVSLNATNAGGSNTSTKMRYITVNPPAPVANFAASQLYGSVPLTVTFTDRSTNSPTTWRWTFGDGSRVNTTRQNPVHTYTDVGTYNVSLKATNAGGSNTVTKKRYIGVLTPYPTLTPTIFPASGKVVL
jgi:PKD repeat protein